MTSFQTVTTGAFRSHNAMVVFAESYSALVVLAGDVRRKVGYVAKNIRRCPI